MEHHNGIFYCFSGINNTIFSSGKMVINVLVLDANDNAPVFTEHSYNFSVVLSDPANELYVGTVAASDLDAGTNGMVFYRIHWDPSEQLVVDSETGQLKSRGGTLNCTTVCSLTVEAFDGGNPPLSSRTFVHVRSTDLNSQRPKLTVK